MAAVLTAAVAASQGPEWELELVPPSRAEAVYDSVRGRVVLVEAEGSTSRLWEWDDSGWQLRYPGASPASRTDFSVVHDAARRSVLMFGGVRNRVFGNELWSWDGTDWTLRQPAGAAPPPMRSSALADDSARQAVVMAGVSATWVPQTWEWDGSSWTQVGGTQPPPLEFHAMVFDPVRRRTVLFGGRGPTLSSRETWEYDGIGWQLMSPTTSPTPREDHAMAFHPRRQRIVLFGGRYFGPAQDWTLGDTWEYDGVRRRHRA